MSKTKVSVTSTPLGTGKTTTVCDVLREKNLRALILTPSHALAEEIMANFGTSAFHIFGKDFLMREAGFVCPHHAKILQDVRAGRGSFKTFCHSESGCCEKKNNCEYLNQFTEAESKQVLLLTHDHLSLSEVMWDKLGENRDVLVIDENFLPKLRKEEIISHHEINTLGSILKGMRGTGGLLHQWVRPLQELFRGGRNRFVLPEIARPSSRLLQQVDEAYRRKSRFNKIARNPLRVLCKACETHSPLLYRKEYSGSYDVLTVNLMANIPRHLPIIVLDSTCKPEYYQWALGSEFEVKGINPSEGHKLAKNAHVVQCLSGAYPNATLLHVNEISDEIELTKRGKRIIEFIRREISGSDDFGIISTKKMENELRKVFPEEKLLHFNNLRGRNVFNNVGKLFVIGFQGISYLDLVRQARILFNQEWDDRQMAEELRAEKEFLPIQYWEGGLVCKVRSLHPVNKFIRAYWEMMVVGEVEQALGRARLYLPVKKDRTVFLLTNLPVSVEIDEITSLWKHEDSEELNKLVEAGTTLLLRQDSFTREELQKESHVGKNTVGKHILRLCARLDLIEETTGRNKKIYRKRIVAVPLSSKEKVA